MADVDRLPSGKWQARTRVDGRQLKRSFARKADAQAWLAEVTTDRARGQYVDHRAGRVTVSEYARSWADARPHRPSTARRVTGMLTHHVDATPLGAMRLGDVRPSDVQAWATGRAQVLAPGTARLVLGLVRSVFASAVLDRLIGSTPVVRVALPRAERPRVVPLSVEQVRALAAAAPARYRRMVIVQAALGLRMGELRALRVDDVEHLRRVAHVRTQFPNGSRERSEPKTPRSRRDIPLPAVAGEAIAEQLREFGPAEDGSIFANEAGRPVRSDHLQRMIASAVVAAGLPAGTSSHDLRHHYASVLLAAGESVVAVAERLGHESATLVLTTYGHLLPDSEERTRRAVDEAWCAPDVPASAGTVL
ncbi:MAG: tyrosine-type recombinase/integrase [Actinobacteria bacterium]|nr:tyrosine-type recombinase/integrase [Actinomycetota bacterium]